MKPLFEVVFLEEALTFLEGLKEKHSEKILSNIRQARFAHDPKLFKKLTDEVWEFRTRYEGLQYRLLAFWDKTDATDTLVISTHGFVKKRSLVPPKEIEKAKKMRTTYFEEKGK